MAHQQVYQAHTQNKGSLVPGQTISVNNYTVQVERYLSQGGFAHVYLVRTPTPVYNTTHHVLKRIAVANESMLTEVKKEVDIMRLLKGHPNIVHLIDAAWHKMPNGQFEVFILMEYCPGGGIIDMMNRRLRERLAEAEILQIFVDVCEGVAYMHNSRPPLLHRDLKVENILQSSSTSFKLCDFGSATSVSNPPTNMQEIRAVEADLNRHTTLQYRAPEMVDVYSKRPINEKSDVWALGVLLYKLCYYTTPFEEHGPLAILNVQYRIPPYPVYSQEMNTLIASMLREHGAQRPTVFELLSHVHRLRGTKSKFSYSVPVPPPLVSRPQQIVKPSASPNPLNGVVIYGTPGSQTIPSYDHKLLPNPSPGNQGIQARDKVLEAIAPMRRGRPDGSKGSQGSSSSRPSSPQKSTNSRVIAPDKAKGRSDGDFKTEQDKSWKSATERSSAVGGSSSATGDGWNLGVSNHYREPTNKAAGFGDDFAEKLWSSQDPNSTGPQLLRLSPRPPLSPNDAKGQMPTIRPMAYTGLSHSDIKDKDAFAGLGLTTTAARAAPTLGEARKLRTGLAMVSPPPPQGDYRRDIDKVGINPIRPSPSPRANYLSITPFNSQSISPTHTPTTAASPSWKPATLSARVPSSSSNTTEGGAIESRFPSLEELDARFTPSANALYPSAVNLAGSSKFTIQPSKQSDGRSQLSARQRHSAGLSIDDGRLLKPSYPTSTAGGVRSEQVTGIAMREPKEKSKHTDETRVSNRAVDHESVIGGGLFSVAREDKQPRAAVIRKHRSSVTMKHPPESVKKSDSLEGSPHVSSINLNTPKLPPRPSNNNPPRDWLTGDDDHPYSEVLQRISTPNEVPVLRNSPSKRASYIEQSDFDIPASAAAQHVYMPDSPSEEPLSADLSPTVSKFKRAFPAIERVDTQRAQSVSSGLTDNWSPVTRREREPEPELSSADEGPEDPGAIQPAARRKGSAKRKGRQSSVHELVSQYGGGVGGKEKEPEREREPFRPLGLGDYKPQKPRPSGLAPPPKPSLGHRTPSPTSIIIQPSPAPLRSPQRQASMAVGKKPQPSAKPPATSRPRPRPQSMFIFPSKSSDGLTVTSPNLAPPEESRPRAARRTSISDMVQHYEAIGGGTKPSVSPGPPSPVRSIQRPVTKNVIVGAENCRNHKPLPLHSPSKASFPSDSPAYSNNDAYAPKSSTTFEPSHAFSSNVSKTPTKPTKNVMPSADRPVAPHQDDSTPRARRISHRTGNNTKPFDGRDDSQRSLPTTRASLDVKPADAPSSRKPAISITSTAPPNTDDASSPERPYQGVGKLIDQWQKKSAEAEQSRPAKRGGFVPKRAGLIHGDDG